MIVIGLDSQNKEEKVDFCKERQLEHIIEKLSVEYGVKAKDLYLVSPNRSNKELNLIKSPLGMQNGAIAAFILFICFLNLFFFFDF